MTKAEPEKTGLKAGTRDRGLDHIPEGLLRPRKGPYDKDVGRMGAASEAPHAFPDRDPAKKTREF